MILGEDLLGISYADRSQWPIALPEMEVIEGYGYFSLPSQGISAILANGEVVTTVQLHAHGHEGFAGYVGRLPMGLAFTDSRARARALLGAPQRSGEEKIMPILGRQGAWDIFNVNGYHYHLQYETGEKSIILISVSE